MTEFEPPVLRPPAPEPPVPGTQVPGPPPSGPPPSGTQVPGAPMPGAPYPYPPYPYPPYPYAVQPPFNTYAILATVFAFAVFAPLGIYFGNKAKQQIAQTGERGIELANVGVIAGWILTCLQAAFLIVWCSLFGSFFLTFASAR